MKFMRFIYTILFVTFLVSAAYAAEVLVDTPAKNIQLVEIKSGKAVLKGAGGAKAEVGVGDSIGQERGKVVEIKNSFITVETGDMRLKLGMALHFEK